MWRGVYVIAALLVMGGVTWLFVLGVNGVREWNQKRSERKERNASE